MRSDFSLKNISLSTGFFPRKGGSYGSKTLYKNIDLTQDFSNKISFHFLSVKMLSKNLPKIFRWPEMCSLDKTLAQDFQMAAFTKILWRRDRSVVLMQPTPEGRSYSLEEEDRPSCINSLTLGETQFDVYKHPETEVLDTGSLED